MSKDYREITGNIREGMRQLRREVPAVMKGFGDLSAAATKDGVLTGKTKEFIALAIGVATHCDGCIGFHTQALARLGATAEEVAEVLAVAVYMGGGPSLMHAAEARKAFDQALEQHPPKSA